jgi:hypothetical protein
MPVEYDEFKGNKLIKLYQENDAEKKYGFVFGKTKAKLIMENIKEIEKFAKD